MSTGSTVPGLPGGASLRLIDRLIERFETRHQALANQIIQYITLPVLMWSGFAFAKTLPEPSLLAAIPGLDWAVAAAGVFSLGYALLSWRIGLGMWIFSLVLIAIAVYYGGNEVLPLWQPALVFLALSTVLWLVGRRIEGRPRLLGEMVADLLIGPAWLISKVLRLSRIGY